MEANVTVNLNVSRVKSQMTFTMTTPAAPMFMQFVTTDPEFLRKLREEIDMALIWGDRPKGS